MKAKLVQIGNSKGIRLPKAVIEQLGLGEEIELEVQGDAVLIRSLQRPRAGWSEAFQSMANAREDALLDGESSTDFDAKEWRW